MGSRKDHTKDKINIYQAICRSSSFIVLMDNYDLTEITEKLNYICSHLLDLMLTMPGRLPNESSRSTLACPARKSERDPIALSLENETFN